jgi:hypothetical protein
MNQRVKLVLTFTAIVLLAFLGGFLPEYFRVRGLQQQIRQADLQLDSSRVRDLAGMTFLQTSLKNYGLAGRYSSEWFEAAKSGAARTESPELRQVLDAVLAKRDLITAQLARGDPAAYGSIQGVYQMLLSNAVGTP